MIAYNLDNEHIKWQLTNFCSWFYMAIGGHFRDSILVFRSGSTCFFHFFYRDQICHKTVTQYGYIGVLCVGLKNSVPHTRHLMVILRSDENLLVRLTRILSSNQCNNQPQKKFEKKSTDLSAFSTTRQCIVMSNISVWNFISSTEIIVTIFSFFLF